MRGNRGPHDLTDADKTNLKLLWIACGTGRRPHRTQSRAVSALKQQACRSPGRDSRDAHLDGLRDNLVHFLPLLFNQLNRAFFSPAKWQRKAKA